MGAAFAQQTSGPATATGNNTNIGALIQDRLNNIVETVGVAGTARALRKAQFIQPAQTALTAITTAQNLFTATLNPGVLNKLLRTLKIQAWVIYTSAGTTQPVLSFAVTLGGVTLCTLTLTAMSATAGTNLPGYFEFTVQVASTGSAGTIESHGQALVNVATAGAASAGFNDANTAVSSAVNLGTALTLNVTVASTLALSSMQLRNMIIEVIN